MLKFALILTVFHAHAPADEYMLDYGLTGEDCAAALYHYKPTTPDSVASCQLDPASLPR